MYSNKIFEIFKAPKNAGGLQGSNGIGKYIDSECGDVVKMYLIIDEEKVIDEAQFKTMGSTGAIVASDVLCDIVMGLNVEEARAIKAGDILEVTGDYPANKLYTVDFAIKALNLALDDYFEKLEKGVLVKAPKKAKKTKKANEISTEFTLQDDENLFSDQIKNPEPMPDLFEKYFSGIDNTSSSIENLTEEELNLKANKRIEEAKSYTPVVETKIIKGDELPKKEEKPSEEKTTVSKAKAMFDAMFEE